MLFKIFFQAFTLYLFLGGYFLTFIIMMFQQSPILNSFWISFIGGFTFCCIWGFCIKLLTILFSKQELSSLFGVPLPEGIADAFNEEDDDDDLTLTDLYNPPDDDDLIKDDLTPSTDSGSDDLTLTDLYNPDDDLIKDDPPSTDSGSIIRADTFIPPERDDLDTSEATTSGRLDANGKFDLTADGKTLKASPQDGAQAVRKVIHDSENK